MPSADADVIVVGAGLSGLAAGRAVQAGGASVRVLEARDRVGGRTLSRDVGRGRFDLGGQWIGPGQRRVAALAEELGLRTFRTHCDGTKLLEVGGRLTEYRSAIPSISVVDLVQLRAALALLERRHRRVAAEAPWLAPGAAALDGQTLETWKQRVVKRAPVRDVLDVAVRVILGAEPGEVSLLYFLGYLAAGGGMLRLSEIRGGAQQDRFVDGAQSLSTRLAGKLGDAVVLSAAVRSIATDEGGVTVDGTAGPLRARRVIVAVPPALAGRIAYHPPLPPARDRLTQRFPMGATVKVMATYESAFWRDRGYSGEVVSSRGPMSVLFDNCSHDGRQPALLGFIVADAARRFGRAPAAERRRLVIDALVRWFGPAAAEPTEVVEHDWSEEPWTRGCPVGVALPGALRGGGGEALRAPVGRVHWAGTETAREWTGYLEGALEAGERAAAEALAAL